MRRRFQLTKLAFVVFAMATLSTTSARAATPSQISIQGKLTDADGNPVAPGVKVFQFRVFDASVGGSLWWPFSIGFEQQNISTNSEGLWTAMLGAVTPLTGEVFADTSRWLEIRVDGQLLSPRVRLGSALRVSTVDGATGGVVTGNVYLKGTTVGPAGGAYLQFNDGSGTAMGYVGDGGADQDLYFFAYIGDVNLNTSSGNLTLGSNGRVGIGTSTPVVRLDVRGDIALGSSGQLRATSGEENLRMIRGKVSANGTILAGSGFSAVRTGTGAYSITFDTPFAATPTVVGSPDFTPPATDFNWVFIDVVSNSQFNVNLYALNETGLDDGVFQFIAVGPR